MGKQREEQEEEKKEEKEVLKEWEKTRRGEERRLCKVGETD